MIPAIIAGVGLLAGAALLSGSDSKNENKDKKDKIIVSQVRMELGKIEDDLHQLEVDAEEYRKTH